MNPNAAPEGQGQPPIPQPEAVSPPVAGVAQTQEAFSITGPAQPLSKPETSMTSPSPNTSPEAAVSPGAKIAETLAGSPSSPPEAGPAVSPEPAPAQTPTSQPETQPGIVQNLTPAESMAANQPPTPTESTPPVPEPITGLSPDASSTPDTTANQTQTPNSEADIIKSMEPGNAGLVRNDGTSLGNPTTQSPAAEKPSPSPTEAGATPQATPETPETQKYEAVFENWKNLNSIDFTIAFNSFMQNMRSSGTLDSATEEGLIRHYTATLAEKTGLIPEEKAA